jgi:translation initiation factor 3 subunit A
MTKTSYTGRVCDICSYKSLFYVLCRMASRLLVAVLSIPLPPPQTESDKYLMFDEVAREKSRRLATLLGLQTVPTRKKLVSDLVSSSYSSHPIKKMNRLD